MVKPVVGAELPLEEAGEAHRLIEERKTTGKVVLDSVTALVTGSAGGIGSAIVGSCAAEGFEVKELDLVDGFDVTDPDAWEHVGSVDLACLNAGVLTGGRRHRAASRTSSIGAPSASTWTASCSASAGSTA